MKTLERVRDEELTNEVLEGHQLSVNEREQTRNVRRVTT